MIGLALAALLAACGGDDDRRSAEQAQGGVTPLLHSDGPLRGLMLTTARVRRPDSPIEPQITFRTSDVSAYAVVGVGEGVSTGAELTVTWYRWEGEGGPTRLFSHELEVSGGGRAVSQGVARTGLPSGVYETVATLDGHQVRTMWFVNEAPAESRSLASAAQSGAGSTVDPGLAYFMGWTDVRPPDEPAGPCAIQDLQSHTFIVTVEAQVEWRGACTSMDLAATVAGPLKTFASLTDTSSSYGTLTMSEWFCDIPGGSDMPGTEVRIVATGSGGATRTVSHTLRDREEFGVELESVPEAGARVEPGDTIRLRSMAMMLPPSLGVKLLYLDDGSDLIATARSLSGATEPTACDRLRFVAVLGDWPRPGGAASAFAPVRYRVPANPPPVIEICAYGEGFDATKAQTCASFYTGEVWEGTWDAGFHVPPGCSPAVWPQVGTLRATVAADGSLTGQGELVNHTGVCGGSDVPQEVPVTPLFTGERMDDEIVLEIQLPGLGSRTIRMPRNGDVAEGSLTVPLGGGSRWEIRARLECTTCG